MVARPAGMKRKKSRLEVFIVASFAFAVVLLVFARTMLWGGEGLADRRFVFVDDEPFLFSGINDTLRGAMEREADQLALVGLSTNARVAFVSVIVAEEGKTYWKRRSGASDMHLCVLAAKIENLRKHTVGRVPYDIVVVTDRHDPALETQLAALGAILVVTDVLSVVDDSRAAGRIECCDRSGDWKFFRANLIKVAVFGLTGYDKVVYLDLDVFLTQINGRETDVDQGLYQKTEEQLVAAPGSAAPMAGGQLFIRPTRAAFALMVKLMNEGFSKARGWGNRGWLVGEAGGSVAWPTVDCERLPHYCGDEMRRDKWVFFDAAGDQGLIYATFNNGLESYKEEASYDNFMKECPSIHWYGVGKPWEVEMEEWHDHPKFKEFWEAWERVEGEGEGEVLKDTKCAAILNKVATDKVATSSSIVAGR